MEKIQNYLFNTIKYLNIFALFMMFLILMIQVVTRKMLDNPLPWPEEISLITMIWITFFGAYQCSVEKIHLKMDFLDNKLSPKVKVLTNILSNLLILWFLVMVSYWAYPFIKMSGSIGMPVSELPMWVPYGMVWVSCILMAIEVFAQLVKSILEFKHTSDNGREVKS